MPTLEAQVPLYSVNLLSVQGVPLLNVGEKEVNQFS